MFTKLIHIIMMMILAIGVLASTNFAQNKVVGEGFAPALTYSGLEMAAGTLDPVSGISYGKTFALTSTGEWDSRYLTISINYREMLREIRITGGAWTLAVFNESGHIGTLYGEVLSGDIQEVTGDTGEVTGKRLRINLRATGGTGVFGKDQSRKIEDSLDLTTELRSLQTSGIGLLNF